MPLLKATADALSNNDLVAGVIQEIIFRDELFALLPFTRTNGKAYVYNREKNRAGYNYTNDASAFVAPGGTVSESGAEVDNITTTLKVLIGDVDVDKFMIETEGDTNSQLATQIGLKAKYIAAKYRDALINGDSATGAFDGMRKLVAATANESTTGVNGGAMTFDKLDELLDLVPNGADALVMNSKSIRLLRTKLRAAGLGNTSSLIELPNFGAPILAYNGIPVIRNDFIKNDETEGTSGAVCSSVYAVRLNEMDGLHGLFGGADGGIRIENVGTVQNKDSIRTRLKWYCGLALKSTQSLARLRGING